MSKKNREKYRPETKTAGSSAKPTSVPIHQKVVPKRQWWVYGAILLVLIITTVVYFPSLDNGFTNWDDNVYVTENKLIQDHADAKTILVTPVGGNYHPLTIFSLVWDQNRAAQLEPEEKARVFHATNLVLHLFNTLLVFLFLYKLTGRQFMSLASALLFGIHPMHVESVAWIAERKDVLYTFFFLGGLWLYGDYLEKKKWWLLVLTFLAFCLSAASKPAAIVFPLVLWAIDYFKGRKWNWTLIAEKLPFLAIAVMIGVLTYQVQVVDRISGGNHQFSLLEKSVFAAYDLMMYSFKLFFPVHLSAIYPYPDLSKPLDAVFYLGLPFVVLLALGAYYLRKRRWLIFGLAFFLINTILILQLVSVGQAVMADRYTYVPYIGLFMILTWAFDDLFRKGKSSFMPAILPLLAFLSFCGFFIKETTQRITIWKSSETLWQDAIEKYPHQIINAYVNLGHYYYRYGPYEKALDNYKEAIKIYPDIDIALVRIGNVYFHNNQNDSAISYYNRTVRVNPRLTEAYTNRGSAKARLGKINESIDDFTKALELDPNNSEALSNRGLAWFLLNQHDKAIADYERMLTTNPADHNAWNAIGESLAAQGRFKQAVESFTKAINLAPDKGSYFENRSRAWKAIGQRSNAREDAQKALQLGQKIPSAYIDELNK